MITKHTCPNGVRIVIENMPTVRSAVIGIWIGTGSRYETPEINGISHFLEHMLFKGTKKRSAREIAEAFDRIGGQVNAFTSKEYTCYYAKVLDEKAEYALDILSDMFFNSEFNEVELKKERKVVLEEIKMYEDAPDDIVHDLISSASFGEHSLAYPILGTEDTLLTFNKNTLENYRNNYYTPDNVVISVVGNIPDDFSKAIEKRFGNYETANKQKKVVPPVFCSESIVKKKETEQAHLCLGFPGLPYGSDRLYHLTILNNILGGSMSSRLFQEVREERGLAYSVFSYHSSFIDNGLLTIYAGTNPDQVDHLFETILATVNKLGKDGITEKELENCKAQLKGNLMLSLESTNSRMSRNGKNELLLNKQKTLDDIIQSIERVTLQDVNDLAKTMLNGKFSSSLISPTGKLQLS
ncbi:peptidase M16 [Pueribacillus theae]|uniref:Peptidase M16 n=1 Tax=Pueribacillus theae TaxID=2171751 RepID=A0A2U1K803_9BACI|nr:pitrilysin family protein [Pueribacillus theae]PWA13552.1 peptidase M16 [Pueribacillus theae]